MGLRRAIRKQVVGRKRAREARADDWFPTPETSAEERLNERADMDDIVAEAREKFGTGDGQ